MTGDKLRKATERAMAGPEIPHNEANVPIISGEAMIDDKLRGAVERTVRKCAAWARQLHESAGVEVSQEATVERNVAIELAIIVSELGAALAVQQKEG